MVSSKILHDVSFVLHDERQEGVGTLMDVLRETVKVSEYVRIASEP